MRFVDCRKLHLPLGIAKLPAISFSKALLLFDLEFTLCRNFLDKQSIYNRGQALVMLRDDWFQLFWEDTCTETDQGNLSTIRDYS